MVHANFKSFSLTIVILLQLVLWSYHACVVSNWFVEAVDTTHSGYGYRDVQIKSSLFLIRLVLCYAFIHINDVLAMNDSIALAAK